MDINRNYCIIMAGGIGNRFWPVSTVERPKQFLDFFGMGKSLLQMTVDRFRSFVPISHIIVVTNITYRDVVLQQLPELKMDQILCEPSRRNTAPCIAYAVAHIRSQVFHQVMGRDIREGEQVDWTDEALNVRIVAAPSDHLILQLDKFERVMKEGLDFVADHDSLLTIGVPPTRPETGYGYIQMKPNEGSIKSVKTFTEKPNLELANVFVQSGEFVWNSGLFIWNLRTIIQELNRYLPAMMAKFDLGIQHMDTPREEEFIQDIFPTCPNISIDYGVMEKTQNVYMMMADFDWSDLGTWGSVYEASEKDEADNVALHGDVTFSESTGNIVCLPTGNAALIRGLNNFIVARADNMIVICPRKEEGMIDKIKASIKSKNI